MGKDINEKSLVAKWGTGFFDKLSRDLKSHFLGTANLIFLSKFSTSMC